MKTRILLVLAVILALVLTGCFNVLAKNDTEYNGEPTPTGDLKIEELPEGAAEALKVPDAAFVVVINPKGTTILYEVSEFAKPIELPRTVEALQKADEISQEELRSVVNVRDITNSNSFSLLSFIGSDCAVVTTSAGYIRLICPPPPPQ